MTLLAGVVVVVETRQEYIRFREENGARDAASTGDGLRDFGNNGVYRRLAGTRGDEAAAGGETGAEAEGGGRGGDSRSHAGQGRGSARRGGTGEGVERWAVVDTEDGITLALLLLDEEAVVARPGLGIRADVGWIGRLGKSVEIDRQRILSAMRVVMLMVVVEGVSGVLGRIGAGLELGRGIL